MSSSSPWQQRDLSSQISPPTYTWTRTSTSHTNTAGTHTHRHTHRVLVVSVDNILCVCVCVCDRVYLQFSLDHAHILSPSVAMVTHLRHRGEESCEDVTGRKREVKEEDMEGGQTAGRKRRQTKEETDSSHSVSSSVTVTTGPVCSRPCVSMVIRVEHKEGVAWRNTGVGLKEGEAGLALCFSVRAAVIGPVVIWGRDPKNGPMTDKETETEMEDKVRKLNTPPDLIHPIMHLCHLVLCVQVLVLVFSGVSACWFPVLQSGSFYRLIAANTQVNTTPD